MTSLPNLYQTTAFGLTGLVILDMVSRITEAPPSLIFFDTLHHFQESHDLVQKVREQYQHTKLHTYKPKSAPTASVFEALYGQELWTRDEERYDWVAKVEPAQRAYRELHVQAVLTGRRRSHGGARGALDILEVTDTGLIKVNPLAGWSFEQVQQYIEKYDIPYNALLDRGYKSVGDWHSTQPVSDSEDERAGRWKGRGKTECGIHNSVSRYAQFLMEAGRQQQEQTKQLHAESNAIESAEVSGMTKC
jgi:phosphoadenosine phosphosulfate reductase